MTSVLDAKRRLVLPKDIAEELGLVEGNVVAFRKQKDAVIVTKVEKTEDSLRQMMSWNPKRTGKAKPVKEDDIKRIWSES
jgi:bifunctional DNA-binding transcriptional regulator/antitoxin component of YhaV-PrlF toxin-antitoxin module